MMKDGFLIGDGFVARNFRIRLAGGIDVVLPNASGIHAEHRDQLLQLVALASWAGRFGFQNQGFELLPTIQTLKVV